MRQSVSVVASFVVAAVTLLGVARANMTDFCDARTYVFYPLADQNNYELVQVSVVTRHGDRAPYTIMGGAGTGSREEEVWDKCDFYDYVSTDFDNAENYQRVAIPTNLPFSKKVTSLPPSQTNKQTSTFSLSLSHIVSTCGVETAFWHN